MKLGNRDFRGLVNICLRAVEVGSIRYNLDNAYLSVEDKVIVATDGHMLIAFPVNVEEGEKSGNIPIASLALLSSLWNAADEDDDADPRKIMFHCGDQVVITKEDGQTISFSRPKGIYPKWKTVVPEGREGPPATYVDAHLLAAVQDALGLPSVALWLGAQKDAILIGSAYADHRSLGVLMPVRGDSLESPSIEKLSAEKA